MAEIRCEKYGGIEVAEACGCASDAWASAVEEENSRLRERLAQVTTLIQEALEFCEACGGSEDAACARCQRFRAWLEE